MDEIPEPLRQVIARGMAKDPRSRPSDAAGFASELRDAATGSYGEDWEDRGRSHLAEAALLLLALLWPSGGSPAVAGSAVEHVLLTDPTRGARQPESAHPNGPAQATPGQTTGSTGQTGETEAEHLRHIEHLEHLEHVRHEEHHIEEHLEHVKHEEHVEHLEHEEHLAHLRHLRHEDSGDSGGQSTGRRMARRVRAHPVAATVLAGAAAVVIGVVAAFAATGHNSPSPPSGAPSPGVSTAAAGAPAGGASPAGSSSASAAPAGVPVFDVSFTMARHVNACTAGVSGECPQEPLPLKLVCQADGSCTASSSHWGATHRLTVSGNSMSFTGPDPGVIGPCGGVTTISTITMNITVLSWSGSGATRAPQQLTAQYTVSAPPTGTCGQWYWEATLTS